MKRRQTRSIAQPVDRFNSSTVHWFHAAMLLFALFFSPSARAQFEPPGVISVHSISGQFVVTGARQVSWFANLPTVATNADLVRLEPALLAISAERLKDSLWRKLGISADAPWRGQIFFDLHPAQSLDENPVVISTPSINGWSYRIEMPDVLSRARFVRALTGVVLLELANRNATTLSADLPAWLVDGFSQQLLAADSPEDVLSLPNKIVDGVAVTRTEVNERGFDPLGGVRHVLLDHPALTFEELSWPADAQVSGADGGAYRASAQLFVSELLGLKNGAAELRTMLDILPQFYNWQTAFQRAFRENFPRPIDVEKWWALQTVSFAARDPGPQWTPVVSRDNLNEILSVPVDTRAASNNLPAHVEVSLQDVIRNFDSEQQTAILQAKLHDLELAQLRMTPRLAVLTYDYRRAIADYLGSHDGIAPAATRWVRHLRVAPQRASAADTLKKLDALDTERRTIEAAIKPDFVSP